MERNDKTEVYKDKEESDVILKEIDPEGGFILDISEDDIYKVSVNQEEFGTIKAKAYKKAHRHSELNDSECEDSKDSDLSDLSDLEEIETRFKEQADYTDYTVSNGVAVMRPVDVPKEVYETIISIDEMLEFLDNEEKEIDV